MIERGERIEGIMASTNKRRQLCKSTTLHICWPLSSIGRQHLGAYKHFVAACLLLAAVNISFARGGNSTPSAAMSDSAFLDLVQRASFDFFWKEANPSNGLIKDRSASGAPCSIASVGFGLSAICAAIDHGWISREAGQQRILTTLKTFWEKPQGREPQGNIGYKGFFYHFLDMNTALRTWDSELSSIDTALLLAGIIDAKQYFSGADSLDGVVRFLADSIYYRADWQWMRNFQPGIAMEWTPERGFRGWWSGYNEAMIMNILALGSPTHPAPASIWSAWTSTYLWQTQYGYSYVNFPPLFGHQYSHCWIDFRNINDAYMRGKGITYFENSQRATLAARAYCIANPKRWVGYGENVWGITACDGPSPNGYRGRGAPPPNEWEDGTIAPTAAGGSIPFAPEECIAALRHMYDAYRNQIWMPYGFRDAFNLTVNWWDPDVIGIDEGPIVLMIENYRTQRIWSRFMQNPDIQRGLQRAGFTSITRVNEKSVAASNTYALLQNYPNPFNASTVIRYAVPQTGHVVMKIYDGAGKEVVTLVDEVKSAGEHSVVFSSDEQAGGLYFCKLVTERGVLATKIVLLK
jgi:hypothetical protein